MTKVSRVKNLAVCWVHQVCGEKFRDFFHHRLHTFMGFQLNETATSISTKASCSSSEFSLKLSLAYLEMDESTLLTCVCVHFTLSRMTMQSQEKKNYSWSESKMKQTTNHCFFCKLISWQKPSPLLWNISSNISNFSWCQLSAEQKFSRENFCSLLKIHHETFVVYSTSWTMPINHLCLDYHTVRLLFSPLVINIILKRRQVSNSY